MSWARLAELMDPAEATTATAVGPATGPGPFRAHELVSGRFRIVREIATGGMGIVYEVVDEKLNERRALKCAKPRYARDLPPEARNSLRVTHPNVCRVFEIHSTITAHGPVDFLTMEYVDGGTLASELRQRGPLPLKEARSVAMQICAGVEAAHAQGLLHRDLKSNNVLLTRDKQGRRRAVVTDFGLAQEPRSSDDGPLWSGVAGTVAYLSPERAAGAPATIASDLYALGIVLHEVVAGRMPAIGSAGEKVLAADLPRRWRRVIKRCLDPDPNRRYTSAAQISRALVDRRAQTRAILLAVGALTVASAVGWRLAFPPTLAARLAILPLEAVETDAETTALVEGASADLSSRLTRLTPRPPQLVIIPSREARTLGARNANEAREKLGASHVLIGSVRRHGDRLAVKTAIVDTSTNVSLGERSDEYPANDASAIATSLSGMVAATFHLPRQRSGERLAAAAYAAYTEGLSALQTGTSAFPRAVAAFEKAIAIDPQSVLPRAGLVEACYDAWVATSDQKWLGRGRDELARAEALNADSLIVRLAAGRLHLVPGTFDRAVREYERAIELEPASPDAWRGLARAYQDMGDHDNDAAAAYAKAIEVQPGYFAPLINFGDFYRSRGNYAAAEKLWLQAIAAAPQLLAGHSNLGGLYSDMGRYADAERELRRALDIESSSRTVLNNLGALYQYMERDADAVKFFERARAVGPETDILLLNLGDSYRRLKRDGDAAAAYRRGRELAEAAVLSNPRNATRRAFLAYFALRLGDVTTAEREIVQAVNFGGENRTVLRRAVICFEALGHRDRALAVLQSAPPDVLRELNRQPDLKALRADARFARLLPGDAR